jgi:hypothetical protein
VRELKAREKREVWGKSDREREREGERQTETEKEGEVSYGLSVWVGGWVCACASCRGREREGYVQIVGDAYVIFHAPHALI